MTIKRERPFLGGEFCSFKKAFPSVEKHEITIEREERFEDGRLGCEWSVHRYNEVDVPDQIHCSSHFCNRAGCDIQDLLRRLEGKREPGKRVVEIIDQHCFCAGDFGSAQGKRQGKRCSTVFKVSAKMWFKEYV